jgi:predicted DNA-binding protein (MmcQ/YjbR family)
MVNTLELKAQIARKGKTNQEVYEALGMSKRVWYDRIKNKRFNSDEMYKLIELLEIDNPASIFFAPEVTH